MPKLSLKRAIGGTRPVIGSWVTLAHPAIPEILARAGYDWLGIDLEHSVITIREAEELIRVSDLCGVPALVRLSSIDAVQVKRVLDAGAAGIIVPDVRSRSEAVRMVAATRFPPKGIRGTGLARAQAYGPGFQEHRRKADQEIVVVVQIEHRDAVADIDDILSVEGIDAFMVGPYDLSSSLGVAGKFDAPIMKKTLKKLASFKKPAPGMHVVHPDTKDAERKLSQGFRFLAYGTDFLFLGDKAREGVKALKSRKRR